MNDIETKIAKRLWHRFGNPSVVEWEDEAHKAEYQDAAVEVLHLATRGEGVPSRVTNLSPEQIASIISLRGQKNQREIGEMFGISYQHVSVIQNRQLLSQ